MQKEFDIATKKDIPYLKKIWQEIFKDSDEYTELYFSYKFKEGNTYLLKENGEIASVLYVEYTDLFYEGKIYKGAYFCGISTLEKYRGKGYASSLIKYAAENIKKVDIIYLIPANKPLFDFYKGLGFKEFTSLDKIKILKDEGAFLKPYKTDFDYEKLNEFYEKSGSSLYVKRDESFFRAIYECYKNVCIFDEGYLIWYTDDGVLHLVEYSFDYEKAVSLLKGLLNEKNINEGIIYKKWGAEPFSVCITPLDIDKTNKKYINLMLN